MRVGLDVGRVLHGGGGVAVYAREVARALAGPGVAHEVVLFDLDDGTSRREIYEDALGSLPPRVSVARATRPELETLDLFHAPGFTMPPSGAPRHLFTLHDLTVLSHVGCHTLDNRVRTLTAVAEALSRGAGVIADSETTRREAMRLLALSGEGIEVLPPMLGRVFSADAEAEADEGVVRRLGIDRDFVLAVGSLEPRKNLGRLLDAWALLPETALRDHSLVVVAGTGWLQRKLGRRLGRMARAGGAILTGHLAERDLAALYRRARALVYPSLAEGFGLPVAEAMACGTPVVTSDRSSLPEVAGDAALLVDPEDTEAIAAGVARVLEDSELWSRLRARGLERARLFSHEVVLPRLLALYGGFPQRLTV
ncbi:MAG: glycosyltransferase family 4 protein [Thermoanaerobaculales bacterium]